MIASKFCKLYFRNRNLQTAEWFKKSIFCPFYNYRI